MPKPPAYTPKDRKDFEVRVLQYLIQHTPPTDPPEPVRAGTRTISDDTGIARKEVIDALNRLVARGYITADQKPGLNGMDGRKEYTINRRAILTAAKRKESS